MARTKRDAARLEQALDRLAEFVPYGHLLAMNEPAEFIRQIIEKLEAAGVKRWEPEDEDDG